MNYAAAIEFGSKNITARPFLGPAVKENRSYAKQKVKATIKEVTR